MKYIPRILYWPFFGLVIGLSLVAMTFGVILYNLLPPVWGEPFHAYMGRLFKRADKFLD